MDGCTITQTHTCMYIFADGKVRTHRSGTMIATAMAMRQRRGKATSDLRLVRREREGRGLVDEVGGVEPYAYMCACVRFWMYA